MQIHIDGKQIEVEKGTTILEAAKRIGIAIPTLCSSEAADGCAPSTSCLVCLVKVSGRMLPSCATLVTDGMQIESETEEIRSLRRTALELLLSDHVGDCYAPCQMACPAKMDVPKMLRQIRSGDLAAAISTVKERIAFPTVLGRVCQRPCEKVCRLRESEGSVSICHLKRFVADTDLGKLKPFLPKIKKSTEKNVVIFGGGASGLSAAYYLSLLGHNVVLYEKNERLGGRMRLYSEDELPENVLDAEIEHILSLPIEYAVNESVDWTEQETLNMWKSSFDAVLLATGKNSGGVVPKVAGVFAAGTLLRPNAMLIRSIADGRDVAESIDTFLRTGIAPEIQPPFSVRIGKLDETEIAELAPNAKPCLRAEPDDPGINDFSDLEASKQAARCLQCDCKAREKCRLLAVSADYAVQKDRFLPSVRRKVHIQRSEGVTFESSKCIRCGLCISACKKANEPIGLAFMDRGFDVGIGVPFEGTFAQGLGNSAKDCIAACPTGAFYS